MGGSTRPLTQEISEPQSVPNLAQTAFTVETLYKTVLKFSGLTQLHRLTQVSHPSETSLKAMQQLIELIKNLRSLDQTRPSGALPNWEELIPYVSDEAYEVLETLQELSPQTILTSAPSLVLLESLTPQLLWCVAQSSYTTMQLVEGIQVNVVPPDTDELQGILRLAVILDLQTPETTFSLDLAMGCEQTSALNPSWVIQPDAESLTSLNWYPLDQEEGSEPAALWMQQQLKQLTHQLITTAPALQPWLEGISVDCLTPASPCWQTTQVCLRLDFAFMPYPLYVQPPNALTANAPIDAELLEEVETSNFQAPKESANRPATPIPTTPVTVVEMPLPPLLATTIVRLAQAETLEQLASFAVQQELTRSIHALRYGMINFSEETLQPIVQEAARIANLTYHAASSNFCLLQPELLTDELIPKLLWHVTRSSFAVMQWLGGLTTSFLQPGADWQTGILRLVVVLEFQILEEHGFIDLAVGRFVSADSWQVATGAIVHLQNAPTEPLVPIEQLHAQLQQAIQSTAPEIACLSQGVSVEFLTIDHDWQPGQLTLHTGLEFIPNLF